jgi:hypothetical protein
MYGVGFMRALKLMPEAGSFKPPKSQAPKMNELQQSMMQDYILNEPIPKALPKPLTPLKRGLTTKTLKLKQTPFTIGNFLKGYEMNVPLNHATESDPRTFLQEIKPEIQNILTNEIRELGGVKFQLGLKVLMRKENETDNSVIYDTPTFYHNQIPALNENEIFENEKLKTAFSTVLERTESWVHNESNWTIERIETLWLNIARYEPLRGSSYIDLPQQLKKKQAIINVKNNDDYCLRWALRSALFPANEHSDRTSKYPNK